MYIPWSGPRKGEPPAPSSTHTATGSCHLQSRLPSPCALHGSQTLRLQCPAEQDSRGQGRKSSQEGLRIETWQQHLSRALCKFSAPYLATPGPTRPTPNPTFLSHSAAQGLTPQLFPFLTPLLPAECHSYRGCLRTLSHNQGFPSGSGMTR